MLLHGHSLVWPLLAGAVTPAVELIRAAGPPQSSPTAAARSPSQSASSALRGGESDSMPSASPAMQGANRDELHGACPLTVPPGQQQRHLQVDAPPPQRTATYRPGQPACQLVPAVCPCAHRSRSGCWPSSRPRREPPRPAPPLACTSTTKRCQPTDGNTNAGVHELRCAVPGSSNSRAAGCLGSASSAC